MTWADHGSCVGRDPDIFFPERGADTGQARAHCRACPVRSECLDYALETRQKFGVWGGLTPAQRRRLGRTREEETELAPVRHLRLVPSS